MPLDACTDLLPRTHLTLRAENDGRIPWCGPAALALATGLPYPAACDVLRSICPERYPAGRELVTAWWRDLVAALETSGLRTAPVAIGSGQRRGGLTLAGLCRRGLAPGWYLLRVTDHFLLLQITATGLALLHDNRHTAALPQTGSFARRLVTHAVRVEGVRMMAGSPALMLAG